MSTPLAYFNGEFLPADRVAISLDDAGFIWGATITDRVRTFNGNLFRPGEHVSRFRQSCMLARVPLVATDQSLVAISERLVRENRAGNELSVVWLATPGRLGVPTLVAHTIPIDAERTRRLHKTGARLIRAAACRDIDPLIKHRSRLGWWVEVQHVRQADPQADPLFAGENRVLETTSSNLIAVVDGVLASPPERLVLEGVSLGVVRELANALGIAFVRREVTPADLRSASEVLLSNTTDCLVGVSRIDSRQIPFPGPILNRLLDAWSELVGTDVRPPADS